jgi:hypothetical protein
VWNLGCCNVGVYSWSWGRGGHGVIEMTGFIEVMVGMHLY